MNSPLNNKASCNAGFGRGLDLNDPSTPKLDLSRIAHDYAAEVQAELIARMREHETLRRSEARYRDLFDNAKDAIYVHDLSGRYIMVNSAAEEMFGYTREEFLQMTVFDLVPASQFSQVGKSLKQKLEDHAPTIYEVEVIRKDRSRVPVEVSSRLVYENGIPVGVQGSARDITARKRDEEVLRKSEEQYRVLFDRNPQPMWVYDLKTLAFLAVNDAAVRHYGYSRDCFLAMTVDAIHPHEDVPALIKQVSKIDGSCHLGEWRHCDFGGKVINVEITANVIDFAGRKAGLVQVNDVTAHKVAEEALQSSQVQLQQSQKLEAIGQLAGGIAHDFNNLLTAIVGYSDLTLRRLDENDPLRGNLIEIKKATDRAASLTRQLLAFSRKQMLEPKVLDLNGVVNDMSKMLRRLIGEDIEFVTELSADLGKVRVDPGQVEQILMNLVVNAGDAMPHGGKVTVETSNVTLDEGQTFNHVPVQAGDYTMLAISDTGIGMDEEIQSHVFEPFFTTKAADKGTGIGLSTVYGIVKQSGGYVWVYSEVGSGTVFKVYLPRVESPSGRQITPC